MSDPESSINVIDEMETDPTTDPSMTISQGGGDPQKTILEILAFVREFTRTDVAYITELREQREVLRWADGDAGPFGLQTGIAVPLNGTDAGVPIDLPDGTRFGAMHVQRHVPDSSLDEHHHRLMSLLGPIVGEQVAKAEAWGAEQREGFVRLRRILATARSLRIAFQPIVDMESHAIVGYEALARFQDERSPADWLAEAWKSGHGTEFELMMLRAALNRLNELPWNAYLAVNISPSVVSAPAFRQLLQDLGSRQSRIVLELTEHGRNGDYEVLQEALAPMRADGVRVAVAQVGAGFASLRHVLHLRPDMLKIDGSLTRAIDRDPRRAALASLLTSFAARIGASIVAEGIETEEERTVLRALGVSVGQGYYFAYPDEAVHETLSRAPREPHDLSVGKDPGIDTTEVG